MTASRPSVPPEVLHELRHGHKLEAIRLLRGATGMGLKEAKDTIEALEHAPLAAMQPRTAAPHTPSPPAIPPAVMQALQAGRQAQAIRILREHTGMGLKDAKDTIEALEHAPLAAMQPRAAAPNPQSLLSLPPALVQALQEGRQVQAIRILREHTGMGLKDAVDTIKAQVGAMPTTVLAPGEQGHSKDHFWWLVLCVLLAALVGIWLWD